MASVRVEMSTTLEKLLDKLTALEQYEETLVEPPQVASVDQLTQVKTTQNLCCTNMFSLF